MLLHVLFEHAAGYALFALRQVEEVGLLLPQVSSGPLRASLPSAKPSQGLLGPPGLDSPLLLGGAGLGLT